MNAKKDHHVAPPVMRVAPLGELKVYMVYEHELDSLWRGTPNSNDLSWALALLSSGLTVLLTFYTATFPSDRSYYSFLILGVLAFGGGLYCLSRWWLNRGAAKQIVDGIRHRMPLPEAIQEDSAPNQ